MIGLCFGFSLIQAERRNTEMDEKEKKILNEYHESVFEKLFPFFEGEELRWLRNATRKI